MLVDFGKEETDIENVGKMEKEENYVCHFFGDFSFLWSQKSWEKIKSKYEWDLKNILRENREKKRKIKISEALVG